MLTLSSGLCLVLLCVLRFAANSHLNIMRLWSSKGLPEQLLDLLEEPKCPVISWPGGGRAATSGKLSWLLSAQVFGIKQNTF